MAYICRNIDSARQVKIWSDVMFSTPLQNYINDVEDVHFMHPDSFAIVFVNCVATTLEFSYILRANDTDNKISTNIYNMVVARSCTHINIRNQISPGLDEADMIFADTGLFLSNNSCRPSTEMNCRGLVMTLFDRVSHGYKRQSTNRTVSAQRSKLNILVSLF
ncbi:unnamed protein product [Adineta steineri]|uniref:Uncharacterized protein n=1 Tax=Adineta steineri TaxID=433720 RepID=A0A820CMW8_9BILA|nr:unnamed protein product [Adineta steineri]CAF4218577.1 unnamed protein product [Adineta steineri]